MATVFLPKTRMKKKKKKKTEKASQRMKSLRTPPKPALLLQQRPRLRGALVPRRPRLKLGRRMRSNLLSFCCNRLLVSRY